MTITPGQRAEWEGKHSQWPHTPPLEVWIELAKRDGNLAWRVDTGHIVNLLETAIDALGAAERECDEARAEVEQAYSDMSERWEYSDHLGAKYHRLWMADRARADRAEAEVERMSVALRLQQQLRTDETGRADHADRIAREAGIEAGGHR